MYCRGICEFRVEYELHSDHVHGSEAKQEILVERNNDVSKEDTSNKSNYKHQCCTCGKVFSKACLLRRHEAGHLPVKPFECLICNQGFTQKTSLQRHILQNHQGKKNLNCPTCELKFYQKSNLMKHIQRTHPLKIDPETMFPCDKCTCVYSKLNSLGRHKTKMHHDNANLFEKEFEDSDENAFKVIEQLKSLQCGLDPSKKEKKKTGEKNILPTKIVENRQNVTLTDIFNQQKNKTVKTCKQTNATSSLACNFCEKQFQRSYDLLRHLMIHTQEKPYLCHYCEKPCSTKTTLRLHVKSHLAENGEYLKRVHNCVICHKPFNSIRQLDIHCRIHNHKCMYKCPTCSRVYSAKSALVAHKHKCDDKEFNAMRSLLVMKPINLNAEVFQKIKTNSNYLMIKNQCFICGVVMRKQSHLKQHENSHLGRKPFKCDTCKKNFSTKSSLNLHYKIHTGHKPYICQQCPTAKFSTKSQLSRHQIVHSEQRNFKCSYCNAQFKTKDTCKTHMLTHLKHLLNGSEQKISLKVEKVQKQTYKGEIKLNTDKIDRNELSTSKCGIQNHIVHKKPVNQCLACEKSFQKPSDLRRHMSVHTKERPFVCPDCRKTFALQSTLDYHRKTQEPNRAVCTCQVCGKTYSSDKALKVHLRIHTNKLPFTCEYCWKVFRTSGHRISHIRTNHK